MVKEQNVNAVNSDSVKITGRRVNWKKNESMKVFILVYQIGRKEKLPTEIGSFKKD